jgi:hypothetical protein
MIIKILKFFVLFACSITAYGQVNISFSKDCMRNNSLLLSNTIIDTFGDDRVAEILEKKKLILFVFQIDTLGAIIGLERIIDKGCLKQDEKDLILKSLKSRNQYFSICIDDYIYSEKSDAKMKITDEIRSLSPAILLTISFPDESSFKYINEIRFGVDTTCNLPPLMYIKKQIERN